MNIKPIIPIVVDGKAYRLHDNADKFVRACGDCCADGNSSLCAALPSDCVAVGTTIYVEVPAE